MALRNVRVTVTGLAEFTEGVARLGRPKADPIYRRALKRNGDEVASTTSLRYLSGGMVNMVSGDLFRSVYAASRSPLNYMRVGSRLDYAPVVHYGRQARGAGRRRIGNTRATRAVRASFASGGRPYLASGLRDEIPGMPKVWVEEMKRHVDKARRGPL